MTFVAGDTGSALQPTCIDNDTGNPINLTGATVELQWVDNAGDLQTRGMTIINAAGGVVRYQFQGNELESTQMKFEVRITDSGGNVLRSIELLREDVRAALI